VQIAHARRDNSPVALAAFDLDHFKCVNDRWGHETGDRVLVRLVSLLMHEAREIDIVARVGGEEFVVLLPATDLAGAGGFADRIRTGLATEPTPNMPTPRRADRPGQRSEWSQASPTTTSPLCCSGLMTRCTRPSAPAATAP
jgi:diguanylate cyclase (GGDEF)-like protein